LRPPTHSICVRQTLNLATFHFLPLTEPYFIVVLHQIHDQAIITLNAGICDPTPHCYYFIPSRPPTPSICVRQTLSLITLHFLILTEPYFSVTLLQIHDEAIITLNAGICDTTPHCYYYIAL
jgi:hypothetical protein